MNDLRTVLNLIRNHNRFVSERVDLIASNSWISQFVRLTMTSSLPNSYCIGLPGNRLYGGCAYIDMLERETCRLARSLFPMRHVVLQFLSGMQANISAYNAMLKPGDTVMAAQPKHGGTTVTTRRAHCAFFRPKSCRRLSMIPVTTSTSMGSPRRWQRKNQSSSSWAGASFCSRIRSPRSARGATSMALA